MQNRWIPIVALVVCASVVSAEGLKAKIDRVNVLAQNALLKRDVALFEKSLRPHLTKDFKYIEAGRTQTFDQMVATMKVSLGSMDKVTKAESKVANLKEKGNRATADVTHMMTSTMKGPDKKIHVVSMSGHTVETYTKEGGTWKLAIMDWKESTMMMDGKKMDMGQAGAGK